MSCTLERIAVSLLPSQPPHLRQLQPSTTDSPFNVAHAALENTKTAINMGVPFESLLPYVVCTAFFGLTGAGLSKLRHMQNGGKRPRHSIDQWDKQMMDRDRRLTGFLRGQTDNTKAPSGFELSNPWRVERGVC
ncbi:hypothetical protein TI39_contig323g00016 [Zymoseptoria brevis]|uniref:NADH dehydrogenase [ubiquinone] 1 alpha subcomplex subunit 1 n=1 Tax=Zymoseptoria brevis TaxID=1047168 RepID=A0A0F4GWK1_9PEZI|nr:hypothetical protein TI39_contig323g00016 [Zymoseptoria brevis]